MERPVNICMLFFNLQADSCVCDAHAFVPIARSVCCHVEIPDVLQGAFALRHGKVVELLGGHAIDRRACDAC